MTNLVRIAVLVVGTLGLIWGGGWLLSVVEDSDEARRHRTWTEGGCAILTEASAYARERGGRFYCPTLTTGPAVHLSPHSRR